MKIIKTSPLFWYTILIWICEALVIERGEPTEHDLEMGRISHFIDLRENVNKHVR